MAILGFISHLNVKKKVDHDKVDEWIGYGVDCERDGWETYLKLDPYSDWADIARDHLFSK